MIKVGNEGWYYNIVDEGISGKAEFSLFFAVKWGKKVDLWENSKYYWT